MPTKKGQTTKNEILDISRKLFFDNGYSNTTIADIANTLGISKGVITYYFNTKDEIAMAIYSEFIDGVQATVAEKLLEKYGGYDSSIALSVGFRVTNLVFKKYPQAFDFYEEISTIKQPHISTRGSVNLSGLYNQFNRIDLQNPGMMNFISFAWSGAVSMVLIQYFKGKIQLPFEEFDNLRVKLPFIIAQIDNEVVDRIVKESARITKELDFEILPYFKIK